MVFGTFVAGAADSLGRKRAALLYCLIYSISCLAQHFNSFWMLVLGRVLAGVATSILYTVFESWMVYEHNVRHSLPSGLLSYSFQIMYLTNNLMGAGSTWLSQGVADVAPLQAMTSKGSNFPIYIGGYTLPFDMSAVALIIGAVYISCNWEENYGARAETLQDVIYNFKRGSAIVCNNSKVFLCCVVVSFFESTLYIFIFNWTPLLEESGLEVPFGLAFSTFMLCCMCGSCIPVLFNKLSSITMLIWALGLATFALMIPAYMKRNAFLGHWWSCLIFEFAVGIYFPAMSTLKSEIVPESQRSAVYNIFRAPFNLITSAVLLHSRQVQLSFQISVVMLCIATVALLMMAHATKDDSTRLPLRSGHVKSSREV
jgi:hypothetical protein